MSAAAVVKGRRLELRALAEGDAAALYAAIDSSREALKRRLSWVGAVAGAAEAGEFIRRSAAAAAGGEALVFAVAEQRTHVFVGVVALQGLRAVPGLAELSGWIRSDRAARGYGVEAARLALAHAFREDALHRVFARIDPTNRGARKVLQRLGFKYEGCLRREKRLNGRWIDQECWGLLRDEWKK